MYVRFSKGFQQKITWLYLTNAKDKRKKYALIYIPA